MKVDANPRFDHKLAAKYAKADRIRNQKRRVPSLPRSERPVDPGLIHYYQSLKQVGPAGTFSSFDKDSGLPDSV